MHKFDESCGLSKKEIGIIKYCVKNEVSRQLPILPDPVETKLFFEGRNAWVFSWCLLNEKIPIVINEEIYLELVAKLKREFCSYQKTTHYEFSCAVQMAEDLYHPNLSITKKTHNA